MLDLCAGFGDLEVDFRDGGGWGPVVCLPGGALGIAGQDSHLDGRAGSRGKLHNKALAQSLGMGLGLDGLEGVLQRGSMRGLRMLRGRRGARVAVVCAGGRGIVGRAVLVSVRALGRSRIKDVAGFGGQVSELGCVLRAGLLGVLGKRLVDEFCKSLKSRGLRVFLVGETGDFVAGKRDNEGRRQLALVLIGHNTGSASDGVNLRKQS